MSTLNKDKTVYYLFLYPQFLNYSIKQFIINVFPEVGKLKYYKLTTEC